MRMRQYLAKRLLLLVPTLLGVTIIAFGIMHLVPGGIADTLQALSEGALTKEDVQALRQKLGVDRPVYIQYLSWLGKFVRGNFGVLLLSRESVFDVVRQKVPLTFQLATLAMLISLAIGVPSGILSALNRDTKIDYAFRFVSAIGMAIPHFWLGLLIILGLEVFFHYGIELVFTNVWEDPRKGLSILIWPALALGTSSATTIGRMLRSTMLEVLGEDYIRTARAKGLKEWLVIWRHALKNALIPVVTIAGIQLAHLLGGSVVTETVFGLPGLGRAVVNAVGQREYSLVQAVILLAGVYVVALNLLVDLSYAYLDPRIRYG